MKRGFTLIELSVTLIVMALIVGIALPSVMSVQFSRLKGDAERLLSLCRYLSDVSVTRGIDIRLLIDLDEGTWKVLYTKENIKLNRGLGGELMEIYNIMNGLVGFDDALAELNKKKETVFEELNDRIIKNNKLSDGIRFVALRSAHVPEGVSEGRVSIYFLSNGMIEPFVIVIGNDTDSYSLVSEEMTGRIRLFDGDISEDFEKLYEEEEDIWK